MISNCLKHISGVGREKVNRIEYPSVEVKVDETLEDETERIGRGTAGTGARLETKSVLRKRKGFTSSRFSNQMIDAKEGLGDSLINEFDIKLGALSAGKIKTVEDARYLRQKYNISSINLALFPSSCAPPTLAHENIMTKVLNLPFVDQVWVDVNYKSYTKVGIEHMFSQRLEMIKLVVLDKPGFDYCTLSKDTNVGVKNSSETDTYFAVARALVGEGVLSWVLGSDVIINMIYWKERAKVNLLQVDRVIICTRGKTINEIQGVLLTVFGSKEELDLFLKRVHYIYTTADISSTVAREGLYKMLKLISPKILTYIISQSKVLDHYAKGP